MDKEKKIERDIIELSCQLDSLSCIILEGRLPEYPGALDHLLEYLNAQTLDTLNSIFQEFKSYEYKIHPVIQGILTTAMACKVYEEVSALEVYTWTPESKGYKTL